MSFKIEVAAVRPDSHDHIFCCGKGVCSVCLHLPPLQIDQLTGNNLSTSFRIRCDLRTSWNQMTQVSLKREGMNNHTGCYGTSSVSLFLASSAAIFICSRPVAPREVSSPELACSFSRMPPLPEFSQPTDFWQHLPTHCRGLASMSSPRIDAHLWQVIYVSTR